MSVQTGTSDGSFDPAIYDSEIASRHAEALARVAAQHAAALAFEARRLAIIEVDAGRAVIVPA